MTEVGVVKEEEGAHKMHEAANNNNSEETTTDTAHTPPSNETTTPPSNQEESSTKGKSEMATAATMTMTEDPRPTSSAASYDDQDEENETAMSRKTIKDYMNHQLGGKVDKPAFCLLDGFVQESDDVCKPCRVLIDHLPAVLGRTHMNMESNFFGLGKSAKALSRYQCKIEYRVPSGTIGQYDEGSSEFKHRADKLVDNSILNATDSNQMEAGVYVLTCLGKNPVKVNGIKVGQNERCILNHGSTVKFSAFAMYFLLPKKSSTTRLEIPVAVNKRKRKAEPESASSSAANKKSKIPAFKSMQDELESMSTDELLSQLEMADEKNIWDRRCQFMGATVSYRAVRDAALSTELQTAQATASAQAPGITKQEVVQWIHNSDKYSNWSEIMQRKLEPKSYQTNIAKAMQRAGFERSTNVSVGRHVRWYLPSDLCPRGEETKKSARPSDKDEDNDAGANSDESDGKQEEENQEQEDGDEDMESAGKQGQDDEKDGDKDEAE